jgi:hemolysin activation/secretion protein
MTSGTLAFYDLPKLGGADELRGFIEGRFRDRTKWLFAAEWRIWLLARGFKIPFTRAIRVERVGIAPFYEIGAVAPSFKAIFSSKVQQSYGIGIRFTLERQALFRVDIGFSREDTVISAQFGLPF